MALYTGYCCLKWSVNCLIPHNYLWLTEWQSSLPSLTKLCHSLLLPLYIFLETTPLTHSLFLHTENIIFSWSLLLLSHTSEIVIELSEETVTSNRCTSLLLLMSGFFSLPHLIFSSLCKKNTPVWSHDHGSLQFPSSSQFTSSQAFMPQKWGTR